MSANYSQILNIYITWSGDDYTYYDPGLMTGYFESYDNDLDVEVQFLNKLVGQDYGSSNEYLKWVDNSGVGLVQQQRITVDLFNANLNGAVSGYSDIYCFADWMYAMPTGNIWPIMLEWDCQGVEYSEIIYSGTPYIDASGVSRSLIKTLNIKNPIYPYCPYIEYPVYEFDPIFDVNTGDLTALATGKAVHKYKDVNFSFEVADRQLNTLSSESALLENPFVQSVDVDILDISGNLVSGNYVTNSFNNKFSFSEQQNIEVFGTYTPNFGIRVSTLSSNANIHSSEYYVYGNNLQIEAVSVNDYSGVWLNNQPIGYQSYSPSSRSGVMSDGQSVFGNALYFPKITNTLSGFRSYISGDLAFARLSGESLQIDWGNSQTGTVFIQTGTTGCFSGIVGTIQTNTNVSDVLLQDLISPTGINGKTYSFSTGHVYSSTGIYDVKFYYSGSGSTGNQLIKQVQYRIPDQLLGAGKPQIGDPVESKINFDISFYNDLAYAKADKLDIYAFTGSGQSLSANNLVKTAPVLTQDGRCSFYLDPQTIASDLNYWFKVVPFGALGSGYAWEVGPYSMKTPPEVPSSFSTEILKVTNGDSFVTTDLLTGAIPTSSVFVLDSWPKSGIVVDGVTGNGNSTRTYLTQIIYKNGASYSANHLVQSYGSSAELVNIASAVGNDHAAFSAVESDPSFFQYRVDLEAGYETGYYKIYRTVIS
jgi:hypothetical protein